MCREIVVIIEGPSRGDEGEKRSTPCRVSDPEDRTDGYSRATATSRRSEESNIGAKVRSIGARRIASLAGACRRPAACLVAFACRLYRFDNLFRIMDSNSRRVPKRIPCEKLAQPGKQPGAIPSHRK
jgi:hypothetical protein